MAARDFLLITLGWLAGALVLSRFAPGPDGDGAGSFLLAAAVFVAVPISILAVLRRDVSWLRGRAERERPPVVWVVIGVSIGQAVGAAARPFSGDWTPIGAWVALYILLLAALLLEVIPRLIRPAGWTGIKAESRRIVPVALLVVSMASFLAMWIVEDSLITAAAVPCEAVSTDLLCIDAPGDAWVDAIGPIWFVGWSAITAAAFAWRLRFIAFAGVAMASFGFGFAVQETWNALNIGAAVLEDRGPLIASQLLGALALIAAAAVIQLFERRERTPEELKVLRWFGAAPAAEEGQT